MRRIARLFRLAEQAYDRHGDFLHGMAAGAVFMLMIVWAAYKWHA